ncbi:hypothetical protein [Kandleria vitulina]|uniref:hypothetical protein n=1 Tax=Kandleria vitulina TaxID=1630 RepID=UPI000AC49DDE|nr:hypothetical protein [Kandleria vitulina]
MSWDYSDLSHQAKRAGGPEKFVKNLETFNYNNGLKDGKAEQAIVDLAIAGVAAGGYALYKIIRKRIEKAKEPKITVEEAEESRQQLIQGIKNADVEDHISDIPTEERRAMKMAKCVRCGREFDVTYARRSIGQSYGARSYNDYYPEGDVCEYCATEQMSADYNAGVELNELMGTGWDDD